MKKYFILGIVAFSFMVTTVYAFNENCSNVNSVNQLTTYNQNCPYHNEDCPYYSEKTNTDHCSNNENRGCQHKNGGNRNTCTRHGGCSRCNW